MQSFPQDYYTVSTPSPPMRPAVRHALRAEVCVIGGGFTGLSAALHLAEKGAVVVLLEAKTVGFGASGRNGGQIHTGLRKGQAQLERWLGPLHARDLWTLSEEAKALVKDLVARHNIPCELKSGLVIAAHNARAARALAGDTAHLARFYGYFAARMMDRKETCDTLGTAIYPAARFDIGGGHCTPCVLYMALQTPPNVPGPPSGSTRRLWPSRRGKRRASAFEHPGEQLQRSVPFSPLTRTAEPLFPTSNPSSGMSRVS